MSFYHSQFLLYIIAAVIIISVVFFKLRKNDSEFIEKYWGLKANLKKKMSFYLSLLGICGLLFGLLDLRGAGEKIEANITQEKTVIMIDASSSMLAEDVRPNRFEKSIFLARHFIRRAIGHQIAVILFSDTHRKLVPFTSDLDLLDARLEALAKRNLSRGGTGVSLAIQESVNYLRDSKGKRQGNLLIFTDGEENQSFTQLKIPDAVNVAVVGVGTVNGARIPLRSLKGDFQGYMRFEGKEIVSKLSEKSIKAIGENIENFEYWIASSYSLPTDNILSFLTTKRQEMKKKGEVIIRPVKFHYIIIPSLICWIIGMLLSWGRQYQLLTVLILLATSLPYSNKALAQDSQDSQEPKEDKSFAPFDQELIDRLLLKVKKGGAQRSQKLKLAQEVLKSGDTANSLKLYEENHQKVEQVNKENSGDYINWATSQLFYSDDEENPMRIQGLANLTQVEMSLNELNAEKKDQAISESLKKIRTNRFLALKAEDQKRKKQQKKKEEDKKNKDKKKSQKGEKGEEKDSQESQGEGEPKKSDKDSKNKKKKKQDSDQDKKKDKNKKKEQSQKPSKQKRREPTPKDISSKLKQLLDDDKELQRQKLDTRTRKRSRKNLKNW